jgi:hypothetical protein
MSIVDNLDRLTRIASTRLRTDRHTEMEDIVDMDQVGREKIDKGAEGGLIPMHLG